MYLSGGGVVIFRGELGQLHRFGKITQLMHDPGVSSVISLLTVVRKGNIKGQYHSSQYHENTSLHSET